MSCEREALNMQKVAFCVIFVLSIFHGANSNVIKSNETDEETCETQSCIYISEKILSRMSQTVDP